MLTNGGEARVLGENSPLALALPKALGRAIVSESETRSDCIKSSLVVIISVTCIMVMVMVSVTCKNAQVDNLTSDLPNARLRAN